MKGAQNIVLDALSKKFRDDSQLTKISAVHIVSQTTDPWYEKRAYRIVKHPNRYHEWNIRDGRIYSYRPDEIIAEAWKLIVPQEKQVDIL